MFNSEKAELSIARRERAIAPKNKLSSLIVVEPSYASFDGDEGRGKQSLAYYGEFMLEEGVIDQVIVVRNENIWPLPEHAIPDMFLAYLNLWTEVNQGKAVKHVTFSEGADLAIEHYDHVYLCMGGTSRGAKQLASKVISHILEASDAKICMFPPSKAVGIVGQPSGDRFTLFDISKHVNMRGHFYDSGFSFLNYNNRYAKRAYNGPALPTRFASFTGKFFQYECDKNPLSNKFESLMDCRGYMGHDYGGPNPFVYFDNGGKGQFKTQMRPGETTIQALLRLAPELASTSERISVAYRGYLEDAKNTLDSWKEGVVFIKTAGGSAGRWANEIPKLTSAGGDIVVINSPLIPIGSAYFGNLDELKASPAYRNVNWKEVFSARNSWFFAPNTMVSAATIEGFAEKHRKSVLYQAILELSNVVEKMGGSIKVEDL